MRWTLTSRPGFPATAFGVATAVVFTVVVVGVFVGDVVGDFEEEVIRMNGEFVDEAAAVFEAPPPGTGPIDEQNPCRAATSLENVGSSV